MRLVLVFISSVTIATCLSCGDKSVGPPAQTGHLNNPPVIVEHKDTSTTVGDTLRLYAEASDLDGDSLRYGGFVHVSLTDIKMGTIPEYQFIDNLRLLEFISHSYDRPSRKVTLYVEDGRGGADSTTFRVFVNQQE
jgi:hypothetical protein